jgi:hypothetical protein
MELEAIESGRRKQDLMSHLPHCNIFHFAGPMRASILLNAQKRVVDRSFLYLRDSSQHVGDYLAVEAEPNLYTPDVLGTLPRIIH